MEHLFLCVCSTVFFCINNTFSNDKESSDFFKVELMLRVFFSPGGTYGSGIMYLQMSSRIPHTSACNRQKTRHWVLSQMTWIERRFVSEDFVSEDQKYNI